MTTFTSPVSAGSAVVSADPLRLAVSAYLARFKGFSREHTCSDLNVFFTWCATRDVQPLAARPSVRREWTGTLPPGGCDDSPRSLVSGCPACTRTCSDTPSSRPCWALAWIFVTCRSPPGTPTHAPPCATTARKNLDRHPNYILAAYMASGT